MSVTRYIEPTAITQGERVEWTRSFDDYTADLYTLEYRFRGMLGTGTGFNVTATANGTAFDAAITAVQSAACSVTQYGWQAWLTEIADATNTFSVAAGMTDVLRGFTTGTTTASDTRSVAKIALDYITAAISGQASEKVLEYEISTSAGTRKVKRMSMTELLAAQKHFAKIVANENARERLRQGGRFGQQVKVNLYDEAN